MEFISIKFSIKVKVNNMNAFIVYDLILVFSVFFSIIAKKAYLDNCIWLFRISIFLSFLVLFIPAAIRYDIGTDYSNYVDYFHKIENNFVVAKEPLYIGLNYIISFFKLKFQWFFVITSFLTYFLFYKSFPIKILPIALFLFNTQLYLSSYDIVREVLALMLVAYSLKYINNFTKFYLWQIIVIMIHFGTGLITMVFAPIMKFRLNKKILIFLLIILSVIILKTNFVYTILKLIASLIPKYSWYLTSKYVYTESVNSGLGVFLRVFVISLIIYSKDTLENKYSKEFINFIINGLFFYTVFYLLSVKIHIFGRVQTVFEIYFIYATSFFIYSIKSIYARLIVAILILGAYLYFNIVAIGKNVKTTDNTGTGINPYTTIFDKGEL